ncbi:MAG: gliding motility-associated ABC transporter substrate-binding protein GldG [Dysgonamonadaceae bacterium]|jgi:ABC-2 type transport system permease protein|nr:gliding motility-associated ABC transporter substrate-binding protein GldG [Dysgonamonadaceae bacterium]
MFKQWMTLVSKELRQNLYSLPGVIFMLLFLISSGCMLWLIPGSYHIPDNGYASLTSFFALAPVLLLFLIPALSMRSLAEEKRMQTLVLLRSRPVPFEAIVWAKITALFVTVLVTLLPTLVYVGCLYFYGSPVGNIDLGSVAASYTGLLFLSLAFVCLSVFASSLTSNQVIALIIGLLLCVFFYYGWNLTGLDALSFLSRYQSVQRGLIETRDLAYFLLIAVVAAGLTCHLQRKEKQSLTAIREKLLIVFMISAALLFNFRFDWTKDKRYTIRPETKTLLKALDSPLEIELYLTGPFNPGFTRLQKSTAHLLDDFGKLSSQKIRYRWVDPYRQGRDFIDNLNNNRMTGISVNERSGDGQLTQQVLYPYAVVKQDDRQVPVSLLVNRMGHSGEDNLNLSGELLEYRFARAIQLVTQKTSRRIVFLEGHGEFPEEAVSEITDRLSYEYTIDRGVLSGHPKELDGYDLVIVAGPQAPFTETDKWALDQYLMHGGRILWLVNGAKIQSYDDLSGKGETPAIPNELNLNDLFFTYGFRIEPVVLQDAQCPDIPIAQVDSAGRTEYVARPWYYSPLLVPDSRSEITKGLSLVKAGFSSIITPVGENRQIKKEVLLTSSPYAHTLSLPTLIRLDEANRQPDKTYFNASQLPVAVLLQGVFPSAFRNRMAFSTPNDPDILFESRPAQMIAVASDELITNPLGYDRYSQVHFANEDFIMNAVNFLTDNAGLSSLKNKSLQMQLLNKQALQRDRRRIIGMNVMAPPLVLLLVFGGLSWIRKRKYKSFCLGGIL